jgi:hypothetical protein
MPRYETLRRKANREISAIVRKLNARQLQRLEVAMGSPPSFANVPDSLWQEFETELSTSLKAAVLLLFTSTFAAFEARTTSQYGEQLAADPRRPDFDGTVPPERRDELATQAAGEQAEAAAKAYIETTRKRLADAESRVKTQPDGSPFPPLSKSDSDLAKELNEEAQKALNDARADGVGVTETNSAIVNAEGAYGQVIEDFSDYRLLAIWSHADPSPPENHAGAAVKPCKICTPLLGLDQSRWPVEFAAGPPAHPNCDCHLEYELLSPEEIQRRRLGESLLESRRIS